MTDASDDLRCDDLHAYVDGELGPDEATAFETHLATCDTCGAALAGLLVLTSALEDAAVRAAAPPARLTVISGRRNESAAEPRNVPPPPRRGRTWWAGALAMVAIAAGGLYAWWPSPSAQPVVAALEPELAPRGIEARLSYPGTERYRRLDVARGGQGGDAISPARIATLERAGDWHGLAVVALLGGQPERAARAFANAGTTPVVDSDRAALALVDGSRPALERALGDLERALAVAPGHGPARWNRALVLARLGLGLGAARELDAVAALGEPGWADEARLRAQGLRAEVAQRQVLWQRGYAAGRAMIKDGTPVALELAGVAGQLTIALYDAVRTAPSRQAVEALAPLARALDGVDRGRRLTAYVERIARADFAVRAPLAKAYRGLLLGEPLATGVAAYLARLARAQASDLQLGAMIYTGTAAAHLRDYQRLATASQDPWMLAIAAQETAKAARARGDHAAAERILEAAIAAAQRDQVAYRALVLRDQLGRLLREGRQMERASDEALVQYRDASAAGEWLLENRALGELAATYAARSPEVARAYQAELAERAHLPAPATAGPIDQ
jgi:cellulose synthase operon protein C